MRIWNHDGGEVESCGNASRCVVALTGAKTIETGGGIIEGAARRQRGRSHASASRASAGTTVPLAYPMDTAALPLAGASSKSRWRVNVGNPHLVFFVDDADAIDARRSSGREIEHDPAFPERINVNVAAVRDDGIHMRTWERGAGLTLACGTGACATAVAAIATKRATSRRSRCTCPAAR